MATKRPGLGKRVISVEQGSGGKKKKGVENPGDPIWAAEAG